MKLNRLGKVLVTGVTGLVSGCLVPLGLVLVPALPGAVDNRVAGADGMRVEVGPEDPELLKHVRGLLGVCLAGRLRLLALHDLDLEDPFAVARGDEVPHLGERGAKGRAHGKRTDPCRFRHREQGGVAVKHQSEEHLLAEDGGGDEVRVAGRAGGEQVVRGHRPLAQSSDERGIPCQFRGVPCFCDGGDERLADVDGSADLLWREERGKCVALSFASGGDLVTPSDDSLDGG